MKKLTSLLLALFMFISLSTPAYATEITDTNVTDEETFFELTTSEGDIKVTYIDEGNTGTLFMFEYHNNELYETTRYTAGNTYYERSFVAPSLSCFKYPSKWEVIDFSDTVSETSAILATNGKTTRNLGYMHYNNQYMGEILSIFCYADEWYNPGKTVTLSGSLGTAIECATWIVGALGLPSIIGKGVLASLAYASIVVLVGDILKAPVSTKVTANVTDQRIYGDCTSHTGKPKGDLGDASITYVTTDSAKYAGQLFYNGYTTHDWGTGDLGRMMFWKVFGVEYTPTSWTGVS